LAGHPALVEDLDADFALSNVIPHGNRRVKPVVAGKTRKLRRRPG
jgi:hypothetical protein